MLTRVIKAKGWELFYSKWRPAKVERQGYSILLMFPGDLPVFLNIAMHVCAAQDPTHLVELLVIPDKMYGRYEDQLKNIQARWPHGPVRLAKLGPLEQRFANYANNPHVYCWLQLIRGMERAKTTHALWHDADLFLINPNALKEHYEETVAKRMAFYGFDPAAPYANPWFQERGINHLVASYEMMMDVEWFRTFRPWEHRGHDMEVQGQWHVGDITYRSQIRTPPQRCGWHNRDDDFVHFSYVIGSYRRFFQNAGGTCEDEGLKVLIIRLLIDAFDPGNHYEVPAAADLARGLTDCNARVTYLSPRTHAAYPQFRAKLQRLLASGLLSGVQVGAILNGIELFDRAMGWQGSCPG